MFFHFLMEKNPNINVKMLLYALLSIYNNATNAYLISA